MQNELWKAQKHSGRPKPSQMLMRAGAADSVVCSLSELCASAGKGLLRGPTKTMSRRGAKIAKEFQVLTLFSELVAFSYSCSPRSRMRIKSSNDWLVMSDKLQLVVDVRKPHPRRSKAF